MNGLKASARWGCSHQDPDSCAWCANPKGEEYRVPVSLPAGWLPEPEPVAALPLWEQIEKALPGFWGTPTSGGAS